MMFVKRVMFVKRGSTAAIMGEARDRARLANQLKRAMGGDQRRFENEEYVKALAPPKTRVEEMEVADG